MGVELLCHSPSRAVSRVPSRNPAEGAGAVYLSDFATAGDGASQHTEIAAAYATGKEVRIRAGEYFRTTSKLTLPANSRTRCEDPQTGGFILDMQSNPGIEFGDGSRVYGLGAKSLDYPSSAITNTTDYSLGQRGLISGNNCQFNDVYMLDLAGGIEINGKTGVTLYGIHGEDLRSSSGWAAVVHCKGASNVVGVGLYGLDCDRFLENEDISHDISLDTGTGTNIYPNGYVGQPGGYATVSYVLDMGHTHENEGGCYNISFNNFTLTNCLSSITVSRATGTQDSDLSHGLSATNITILSPRGTRFPIELQGYDITLDYITFGGDVPSASMTQLIKTLACALSDNIVISHVTIPDNWYRQQIVLFQAAGSEFRNANIGPRDPSVTTTFFCFRTEGNGCVWDSNEVRLPTYGTAIWSFLAGTSGCSRTNNVSTLAPSNAVSGVVALNGTTVTTSGNQDLIAP